MRYLLQYLKKYKKESLLAPAMKMLEAVLELCVPLVVTHIIDYGVAMGDRTYVLQMGGVLVLLATVGVAVSCTAQYFSAVAAAGFGTALRHNLFEHVQRLSYAQMDRIGSSTLITRLTSDVNETQSCVNMSLRLLLRSPVVVFGAMICAFMIDPAIALIFVAVIILLFAVVFGVMIATIPRQSRVQANLDTVTGVVRDNLAGARVLRAFNKQESEQERFSTANRALRRMQTVVGRISAVMNPATCVLINLATIALIWAGGTRVNTGDLTQGQVVALANYMAQILVELVKFANICIQINRALASAQRIEEILKTEPEIQGDESHNEQLTDSVSQRRTSVRDDGDSIYLTDSVSQRVLPAVSFRSVGLTYPGAGAESLTDINFTLMPGRTLGIIGGTGSGKTSIVNLIPRFYEATEGSVEVFGKPVSEYGLDALRHRIGIVPQQALLFAGTVRDNLMMGDASITEEAMSRALEISQAAEFVSKLPRGLDAPVSQGGKNFSGGQRQRLTIARALARDPEILIMDDSASALDYATDLALRRAIRTMDHPPATIIVSQRAACVMDADEILVLDNGHTAGQGTHEELLQCCEVYGEIYYTQFPKEV